MVLTSDELSAVGSVVDQKLEPSAFELQIGSKAAQLKTMRAVENADVLLDVLQINPSEMPCLFHILEMDSTLIYEFFDALAEGAPDGNHEHRP